MQKHGAIIRPTGALEATFNPGVTCLPDGQFILLARSAPKKNAPVNTKSKYDDSYTSHFSLWQGVTPSKFDLSNAEALMPGYDFDRFGLEDPRITKIDGTYYILYTSLSISLSQPNAGDGIRAALASTKDFRSFKKHGVIGPNRRSKAGALFQCAGKKYLMWRDDESIERMMVTQAPENLEDPEAWKKLWAQHNLEKDRIIVPQKNNSEMRGIEPGAPPIELDDCLLIIYSGISDDFQWSISAMLADKKNPKKIIAKTTEPLLKPGEDCDIQGPKNVIFPCGALIDKGRIYIYYGGRDKVCALISETREEFMKRLKPLK